MPLTNFDGREFYKLTPEERMQRLQQSLSLKQEEVDCLQQSCGLPLKQADRMIENVVGTMEIPVGLAMNFQINGEEYLIPMAIEEASVVAAASKMAKIARVKGGFTTSSTDPVMIGQIQVVQVADPYGAKMRILAHKEEILAMANEQDPLLVKCGGGARDLQVRILDTPIGPMVICHLLVNCQDAMGANAVNTMVEALAPRIEELSCGKVYLRIISNLAIHRLARAYAVFTAEELGGEEVVDGIIAAYHFANVDPFRATTHNKGIMNGISAVALALGQDTRAIEAGAHAYAALNGHYKSLTTWEKNLEGDLVGTIEVPMAVGLVGGATRVHPVVRTNLKIIQVSRANQLGEIMAAVGLAQNVGALRALATEGIQRGHMALHARNVALSAGTPHELVDEVVAKMVENKKVRIDIAQEILAQLQPQMAIAKS